MTVPSTKSFYYRVDLALDGAVWVRGGDYSSDRGQWMVFDPRGRLRGTFTVPGPFTIHEIGPDYVLGVYRDPNEVEFVRMYEVTSAN